jgi:hypothetical protein
MFAGNQYLIFYKTKEKADVCVNHNAKNDPEASFV